MKKVSKKAKKGNKNNPAQLPANETSGGGPPSQDEHATSQKGKPFVDGYKWVMQFCQTHARFHYDGRCSFKGKPSDAGRVYNSLVIENHRNQLGIPAAVLDASLEEFIKENEKRVQEKIRQEIKYRGSNGELKKWIRAVTGKESALDIAVMEHFIWQVKRKLSGQTVERHMMPILVGKTLSGKTWATEKLTGPVSEISETGRDLSVFGDERQWSIFHRNYVVCFDEMSKAHKVDIEGLKNTITAKIKSYRKMRTTQLISGEMVSTFIGTSNSDVADIIYDPTSARRFWQIDTLDKCDWGTINAIDYLAIWQGVDETADCPVVAVWDAISEVQNAELRVKHPVEEWIIARCEIVAEALTPAKSAFEHFKDYAEWAKLKQNVTASMFGRTIRKIPGISAKKKNTGTFYNIKITSSEKNELLSVPPPKQTGGES